MRTLLALALAALAVPAASADLSKTDATLARAVAGRNAGTPVECITRVRTDDFQVAGDTLIFRISPRLTYTNRLTPGCNAGVPRTTLVFRSTASRICRGEIVESVDPLGGAGGGSCSLGQFVPYERP